MDAFFLAIAIDLAKFGAVMGEVPVAALVVHQNKIIGKGINLKESLQQPSCHAEMLAIQQAASLLDSWRLNEATLYSTLEPCPMCAGAILQARIKKVVFAAKDLRWGAAGTHYHLLQNKSFNHQSDTLYLPSTQVEKMLKQFFKIRRG